MSEALITYRGTVYPWQCDHMAHMNVMWYVGKFDEATWHFFNALGMTPTFFRTQARGMAAVDQHISYVKELHAGDVVTVHTALIELKHKSIRFVHEMTNEESHEVVARTTLKAVHMDIVQRKSCAFPDFVAINAAAWPRVGSASPSPAGR